jgi:putative membrane protein
MWYANDGHMDNGWGIAMMLSMLGIWVLLTAVIAIAIVWSIRATRTPTVPPVGSAAVSASGPTAGSITGSAEQILAERLARGDIDPEDYKARLDALRSAP